jgi:Na+/phosphate symporter
MTTFAATFRELVMPSLARMCRTQGLFVALDLCTFSEASGTVMAAAAKRGASSLPDGLVMELGDWIGTAILKAIDEFTPAIEAHRVAADRVAVDIARCEAAWRTA